MSLVLDIILAALILISFMIGYKKGLVKSIWKIAALAITIILVIALKNPAVSFLSGTAMADNINAKISETIHIPQGGGVDISDSLNLPDFLKVEVNSGIESAQNAANSVNDAAASALTTLFLTIITCVALFIIIRLILMAVYMIINGITEAPIIKGVNKFSGGLLGAVNMVFVIFLLLSLVSLFAPADSQLFEMIESTYVVKYFYNYNILLQLFMKI
ncbi:MAG: CvpA family protein [Hominilimicola sp.]